MDLEGIHPHENTDARVNSRNVDDYKFTDEKSKDLFQNSKPVSEALPTIVERIVTDLDNKGRAIVWVTGAWGVGKTTFGKALLGGLKDIKTTYLDGDVFTDIELITHAVETGPADREVVLVAASFIENWEFKGQAQPPIVINLIADDSTRHGNFYFRAGGPRSTNFDVVKAIRNRQESPNYIIPDPNAIIVDTSEKCRIQPELISQQVSGLIKI